MYAPGDIVLRDSAVVFYVYELIDEQDSAFYVGCTHAPRLRLRQHLAGPGNLAVTAKLAALAAPRLRIVAGPLREAEALAEEARRIASTPALLNRESRPQQSGTPARHPIMTRFLGGY